MTAEEIFIIEKLNVCTYETGTWSKRFVTDLAHLAKSNSNYILTEPQKEWVYRLLYMLRKQVPFTYKRFKKHPHCKKLKVPA